MEIPSWVDEESWEAFIEMRKSIKKPLTEFSMKLAIGKLERLLKQGHDPSVKNLVRLKPCPWCGSVARKGSYFNGGLSSERFYVVCSNLNCHGEKVYNCKSAATKAWNRRAY